MTCPVCDRVQKSVRVNREEPPGDLKEGRELTVNPTLLYVTQSHNFKHVGDARCIVVFTG